MISDDAYRNLEAVGKQLLHSGDITPTGLRALYDVLLEEVEKGQREAPTEHSQAPMSAGSEPMRIWKATFPITDETTVEMPAGARPLRVAMQHGTPTLWFLTQPSTATCQCRIRVIGTGNQTPGDIEQWHYLGTIEDRVFVWHIFLDPDWSVVDDQSAG